ncbi:hypothetical protein ABTL34_19325, partial [Acinetobacter baumannii]
MHEYKGAMKNADSAIVFYSNHALELKRMPPLPINSVVKGFEKDDLIVLTDKKALTDFFANQDYTNANLLLMSSGNYDGI